MIMIMTKVLLLVRYSFGFRAPRALRALRALRVLGLFELSEPLFTEAFDVFKSGSGRRGVNLRDIIEDLGAITYDY